MAESERVFAMNASPEVIWRLLLTEVEEGEASGRALILHQEAPRELWMRVRIGWGLSVLYRYELWRTAGHTEVSASVSPQGIRWALGNILSLGRGITPYMLALTQGLANLKEAAEREPRR